MLSLHSIYLPLSFEFVWCGPTRLQFFSVYGTESWPHYLNGQHCPQCQQRIRKSAKLATETSQTFRRPRCWTIFQSWWYCRRGVWNFEAEKHWYPWLYKRIPFERLKRLHRRATFPPKLSAHGDWISNTTRDISGHTTQLSADITSPVHLSEASLRNHKW